MTTLDSGRACKFLFYSFFLIGCGIGFLAAGATVIHDDTIVKLVGTPMADCGVAFGILVALISVVGIIGVKVENRRVIIIYMGLMVLIAIAVGIVGIYGLARLSYKDSSLTDGWADMSTDDVVSIENHYTCCGTESWGQSTDNTTCPCTSSQCGGCFDDLSNAFYGYYAAFGLCFAFLALIMAGVTYFTYNLCQGFEQGYQSRV